MNRKLTFGFVAALAFNIDADAQPTKQRQLTRTDGQPPTPTVDADRHDSHVISGPDDVRLARRIV